MYFDHIHSCHLSSFSRCAPTVSHPRGMPSSVFMDLPCLLSAAHMYAGAELSTGAWATSQGT